MKRYISLWLVCLLAVFSMTARAQEGIETKARPDFPALPFTLNYTAPEGAASFSLSADGKLLPASSTTGLCGHGRDAVREDPVRCLIRYPRSW